MFPHRYNRTNFVSSAVAVKVLSAMRESLKDGLQHYVENKRGQRWLRVCVKSVEGSDNRFTFEFLAGNGQDVGHLILQALFVWSNEHEREFSVLSGELYRLTNHPYILHRQTVAKEKRAAAVLKLKTMGVRHSFRTDGGISLLGRWRRNWLGRKVFEVLADAKGNPVKPYRLAPEAALYGSVQGFFA